MKRLLMIFLLVFVLVLSGCKEIKLAVEGVEFMQQTQTEQIKLEADCKNLVCNVKDFEKADEVCYKTVNRPGYAAFTYPVQYLQAKTIILLSLGKSEEAFALYQQYKNLTKQYPYLVKKLESYFQCFNEDTDSFDKECLERNYC